MARLIAATLLIAAIMVLGVVSLYYAQEVSRWERANGYPYGRLCDVFHTCGG